MSRAAMLRPSRAVLRAQVRSVALLCLGASIQAVAFALFQIPYQLAPGGASGLSLLLNHFTGLPVGTAYFLINVPLFVLGFYNLGRWNFLAKTVLAVVVFSALTDFFVYLFPLVLDQYPVTDNVLLSAIFGAIFGGVGGGLVYRSGASAGGTSILGRVIQVRTGIPLSQVFLMTDGTIVVLMGLTFGWETSLYALLMLFLWGMAADYVLEGPATVRTVTIVTTQPDVVVQALRDELGRTVTHWQVTGGYSGEAKHMLLCTVQRPQVSRLRAVILGADPEAFFVVGDAHNAVGGGFGR